MKSSNDDRTSTPNKENAMINMVEGGLEPCSALRGSNRAEAGTESEPRSLARVSALLCSGVSAKSKIRDT